MRDDCISAGAGSEVRLDQFDVQLIMVVSVGEFTTELSGKDEAHG